MKGNDSVHGAVEHGAMTDGTWGCTETIKERPPRANSLLKGVLALAPLQKKLWLTIVIRIGPEIEPFRCSVQWFIGPDRLNCRSERYKYIKILVSSLHHNIVCALKVSLIRWEACNQGLKPLPCSFALFYSRTPPMQFLRYFIPTRAPLPRILLTHVHRSPAFPSLRTHCPGPEAVSPLVRFYTGFFIKTVGPNNFLWFACLHDLLLGPDRWRLWFPIEPVEPAGPILITMWLTPDEEVRYPAEKKCYPLVVNQQGHGVLGTCGGVMESWYM